MASNWMEVPLEKLKAQTKSAFSMGPFGSKIKAENFTTAGVPVIKGGNLNSTYLDESSFDFLTQEKADELESAKARRLDIVITHRGTLGQVGLIPEDSKYDEYVVSQSQLKMSFDIEKFDPYFIYYFLKSPLGQSRLLSNVSQVGVPAIAQALTSVRSIEIPIPQDRAEQVRISKVLRDIDQKINVNRQTNQTLESMGQAIFKSWFVDFEPVKAKIAAIQEGRDPLRAAMGVISGRLESELDLLPPEQYEQLAATAELFPKALEESDLGEIPRGWSVMRIRDVVEGVYDGPHATPPEATEGAVFLGIRNLTGTSLDMSSIRHIAEADWGQWTRRVEPRAGDIVFSYEATLGYFALLPPTLRCCLGRRLALIRPHVKDGFGSFWFHQFVAQPFQRFLEKHTIPGATVNRIALKDFPSFPVLKPAEATQAAFCDRADRIWSLIHANQAQSEGLEKLRDTLLPKLLSGELSVGDLVDPTVAT